MNESSRYDFFGLHIFCGYLFCRKDFLSKSCATVGGECPNGHNEQKGHHHRLPWTSEISFQEEVIHLNGKGKTVLTKQYGHCGKVHEVESETQSTRNKALYWQESSKVL